MALQVSENLSRIKQSALELNALADEATAQIRGLDKFLEDLHPGIEVCDKRYFHSGREGNSNNHQISASYTLGYGRDDDGRFGLVVHAEVEQTDDDGRVVKGYSGTQTKNETETAWVRRLDQTTRPIRIAALARLPEFIGELSEQMEQTAASVRENLAKVRLASAELHDALLDSAADSPAERQRISAAIARNAVESTIAALTNKK